VKPSTLENSAASPASRQARRDVGEQILTPCAASARVSAQRRSKQKVSSPRKKPSACSKKAHLRRNRQIAPAPSARRLSGSDLIERGDTEFQPPGIPPTLQPDRRRLPPIGMDRLKPSRSPPPEIPTKKFARHSRLRTETARCAVTSIPRSASIPVTVSSAAQPLWK